MEQKSQDEVKALQVDERFEIIRTIVSEMDKITEFTDNAHAKELMAFVEEFGAIGAPAVDGGVHWFIPGTPKYSEEKYFFFSPIIPQDAERLPKDDFRLTYATPRPDFIAQFREGSNAIYFSPESLSPLGLAIILLHEVNHAHSELTQRYDKAVADAYWDEEAETYIFEFEILSALIKDDYEVLVNDALKQTTENEEGQITFGAMDIDRAALLWRDMFGPDISETEIELWTFVAHLDSIWRYLKAHPITEDPIFELAAFLKEGTRDPNEESLGLKTKT